MKEIKILFILFFLNGCSHKTQIFEYYRNIGEKKETIQIDLRANKFVYKSEVLNDKITLVGDTKQESDEEKLILIFPEFAEIEKLGPFKKGYFELIKVGSSDQIDLKLIPYSLNDEYFSSDEPLDFLKFSILFTVDSVEIERFTSHLIQIDKNTNGEKLRILGGEIFYDLEFEIPTKGKYEVNLYFQPVETTSFYDTGTQGCSLVTTKPKLYTYPNRVENDTIKSFGIEKKSKNLFILKE